MALNGTKDMRLPIILRRFKHMDLVFSIEARLRASANTGLSFLTKKELSILSEWQVAKDRVQKFNEELIAHRERLGGVEVDLLLRSRGTSSYWALIEVKSRDDDLWDYGAAVPVRQRRRYAHVAAILRERWEHPVGSRIAVVSHRERGLFAPDIRYFDLEESLY